MKVLCIGVGVVDIAAWPVSRQTEWQEKQRISGISIQAGGDAVNQAVYLSQLGMEACVNICVGRDENGVLLKEAIRKKGVDTSFIRVRDDAATGTALVLIDEKGERRVFSAPGANGLIRKTDLPEEIPEHLQAVSLASLFGMDYLERDGLEEFLDQLKEKGIPVFADLLFDKYQRGLNGIAHLLERIDFFLPSSYDALSLTGTGSVEECAAFLRKMGPGTVIIKCGAKGVYADSPDFRGWIPALKLDPVDTTGAGDCFAAVFLAATIKGYPVREACQRACRAASLSTLSTGASSAILAPDTI